MHIHIYPHVHTYICTHTFNGISIQTHIHRTSSQLLDFVIRNSHTHRPKRIGKLTANHKNFSKVSSLSNLLKSIHIRNLRKIRPQRVGKLTGKNSEMSTRYPIYCIKSIHIQILRKIRPQRIGKLADTRSKFSKFRYVVIFIWQIE